VTRATRGVRRGPLAEALAAWALVSAGAAGIVWLLPPGLDGWSSLAVGALFLGSAIRLAARHPGGLAAHGIDLGGVLEEPADGTERADEGSGPGPADPPRLPAPLANALDLLQALRRAVPAAARETAVALGIALVLFPPYGWLYGWFHMPGGTFDLRLPPQLLDRTVGQLLVVALPEEAFFRGYLHGRLDAAFPTRRRLFGVRLSPAALVVQAMLFGLVHAAVDGNPARLATAVPGLLFGWVRSWRGGVGAAIVLHAASNLCADVLARSWTP